MTPRTKIAVVAVTLVSLAPFCVGCTEAPAVVGTATEIPGVVEGGSPIQRLLEGYKGLDDPIGLMDGTLVFSEPDGLSAAPPEHGDQRGFGPRCGTPMNRTA